MPVPCTKLDCRRPERLLLSEVEVHVGRLRALKAFYALRPRAFRLNFRVSSSAGGVPSTLWIF